MHITLCLDGWDRVWRFMPKPRHLPPSYLPVCFVLLAPMAIRTPSTGPVTVTVQRTSFHTTCRIACPHAGGQTSLPGDFLRSLRSLLSAAAASPPSAAELSAAKAETLNSFAFNFSSTSSQLQRILVYDLLGLPQVGWALGRVLGF